MGIYLNRNNDSFKTIVADELFQDKSGLISILNERIDTGDRFLCITRPRRFGKTVNINMIDAYYSKGCDSKELFDGLSISKDKDYETHLNKYNVIHLDMSKFYNTYNVYTNKKVNPNDFIPYMERVVSEELYNEFSDIVSKKNRSLSNAIQSINNKTGIKFIMLLDEWDAPLREGSISNETKEDYFKFLKSLFKEQTGSDCFSLAYITGIIPIRKVHGLSDLNNFDESSMILPGDFAPYYGFTKDEVVSLCDKYRMNYSDVKYWYDGYLLKVSEDEKIHIFNPCSLVFCMSKRTIGNYWGKTATYEILKEMIVRNYDGLKDDIIRMLNKEHINVDISLYANNYNEFNCKDDVLTQLIHIGYLTYDDEEKKCYIPNYEVEQEFISSIKTCNKEEYKVWTDIILSSVSLLEFTHEGNEEEVSKAIKKVHEECIPIFKIHDENSISCVINMAYISAKGFYKDIHELKSGRGFADIVFLPKVGSTKIPMIIELKCIDILSQNNESKAINQIIDKNYIETVTGLGYKEILLVGITYTKDRAKYTCKIEKWNN